MNKHTYQSGPPPHVGWWLTAVFGLDDVEDDWRWWNGKYWSWYACESDGIEAAVGWAAFRSVLGTEVIKWSHYYPANARVPRVDPRS